MTNRRRAAEDPPQRLARDVVGLLDVLANVTDLTQPIEVTPDLGETARRFTADIAADARQMADTALKDRAESVGKEDAAIEEATAPPPRVALDDAPSSIIGTIRDHGTGAGIGRANVVVKTPSGEVIGSGISDPAGGFALRLESTPEEVFLEVSDVDGRPVASSPFELEGEGNAAHFVSVVGTSRNRDREDVRPKQPVKEVPDIDGLKLRRRAAVRTRREVTYRAVRGSDAASER